MRRGSLLLVAALFVAAGLLSGAAAAPTRRAHEKIYKYLIIGKLLDGKQTLSRASYPSSSYTLSGQTSSRWIAHWTVTVHVQSVYTFIPQTVGHDVSGFTEGSFDGSYPTMTGTTSYHCSYGPITPRAVVTKLGMHFLAYTGVKVIQLSFGVLAEPNSLPSPTCTGDPVDPQIGVQMNAGIFTGMNECVPKLKEVPHFPAKLLGRKLFEFKQKLSWSAKSFVGQTSVCTGFGNNIQSAGHGTFQFRFQRLK